MITWVWLDANGEGYSGTTDLPPDHTKPTCGNCDTGIPREVALITDTPFAAIDFDLIDFEEMWPCPGCGAMNLVVLSADPPLIAPAGDITARQAAIDAVLERVLRCRTPVIRPSALAGDAA
jgi:hypothetical protein